MSTKKEKYDYTEVEDPSIVEETVLLPSTLENIDFALFDFINEELDIFSTTNKGWEKVPVIWVSAERAFQVKRSRELRDLTDTLIYPAITVERKNVVKDITRRGAVYGNALGVEDQKGGTITIARRINQDKTSNFANADSRKNSGPEREVGNQQAHYPRKNKKVVYETITVPIPIYVDVSYDIKIHAEYQQQINEIIPSFINAGRYYNYFVVERNGHAYEVFMEQDYGTNSNVASLNEEERTYETVITLKVLGYLIGDDKNQIKPKIVKRENAVEVKLPREKVVFGEIPDHIDKRGFYKD
tara:strand:+ start:455 stop:1354 length:900 start_codon:yes stop_codon:yes gene_type:complete